jgi:hypothetical protein
MQPPAVLFTLLFVIGMGLLWPAQLALAENTQPVERAELLERLRSLHLLSAGLIEEAGTGRSPANDFQIQARLYREQLRRAMLANRELAPPRQLPEDLLLAMVRMSALLHAAADCKSGLVIVCPPDLLRQLRAQQERLSAILRPYESPGGAPS